MTNRLRKLFAPVSMLVCLFLVLFFFTQMYGATSDMPAIVNPRFKYWTVDQVWKFRKPYMWEVSLLIGPNDDAFTRLDEVGGKTCLGMHVSQDGEIDQYLWATVHVRQNLGGGRPSSCTMALSECGSILHFYMSVIRIRVIQRTSSE